MSVPILVYHYIRVNPNPSDRLGFNLCVTPAHFAAQMDYLQAAGIHPVTIADVMNMLSGGPTLPPHPVVLSFDDGHSDFATAAAPILHRHGFVGTDFVVSGFIGRPQYMTAAQIHDVVAMGMVIGAHTVHHVELDRQPAPVAAREITASRAALERLLGIPVLDFAYPYGGVNAAVVKDVQAAGYRDAVTMHPGDEQRISTRYLLPRIRVLGYDTVASFAQKALL
ncbi:MAG: polysaccharide deacetylase family protein [Candidatus Dormibacteria bacterium]